MDGEEVWGTERFPDFSRDVGRIQIFSCKFIFMPTLPIL